MKLLEHIYERNWAEDRSRLTERLAYFNGRTPAPGPRPLDTEDEQPRWPRTAHAPEINVRNFNNGVLRSAMATYGCLIIRDYFNSDEVSQYRGIIDLALGPSASADEVQAGSGSVMEVFQNPPMNFSDLLPEPKLSRSRGFHREGGSAMCVESASVSEQLLDFYGRAGVKDLVASYLGEPPCLSALKRVLRRPKTPTRPDGWHEDGAFMGGEINSLNMWIPVSRCGGDSGAPSMDIVVKRLRHIVASGKNDAVFDWSVGEQSLAEILADSEIATPQFGPGDVFFFDHFLIYRTEYGDQFSAPRYAIETWFFGKQNFPANQVPLRW